MAEERFPHRVSYYMSVVRETRACATALVLYGAFYFAFFLRSLLSGNYIAPSDSLDFGVAAFLSSLALWTQGMYSGYPIAADPQALTWYPVLHLFRLLGLDWNGFLISAYVIASTACFLFVRHLTGSNAAGAFSGFAYGFGGFMLAYIGRFNQIHAAAWVPLGLYGLQLVREGLYRPGALVSAFAFALMWLAGHPQFAVYTVYLSAALIAGGLLIDRPPRSVVFARLGWSAFGVIVGMGIAAVSIVPMVELGELSRRSQSTWELYVSSALPPWQLLSVALPFTFGGFWSEGRMPVPYFGGGGPTDSTGYVGLLPLALALAAPFVLSTYRRDARLWFVVTVVAVLLCLGDATPVARLFFYAPGYASFQTPARHLLIVSLCLAVTSGLAFAELTRRREGWGVIAGAVAVTLVLASVALAVFAWLTPAVRALMVGGGAYTRWTIAWPLTVAAALSVCAVAARMLAKSPRTALMFAAVLVAVQVLDLAMLHYRMPGQQFRYADIIREEAILHPRMVALRDELHRTGERVLATDGSRNQFLLPNLTRPWDVPAASGTGSLGIERYLDVQGMGGSGDVYPETLSEGHRGLDLFSVRYALVRRASPLAEDLRRHGDRWSAIEDLHYYENDPETHYTLFKNARALPRAWCVPAITRMTPGEALAAIRSGYLPDGRGEFNPARVALVEPETLSHSSLGERILLDPPGKSEPSDRAGARGGDTATVRPTDPPEVLAQVDPQHRYLVRANAPCLLVLSEVYYPWWRASLDDEDIEVARVNHTMIGIPVPSGSHVVRLRLVPASIWWGAGVTVISLLTCGAVIASGARRRDLSR